LYPEVNSPECSYVKGTKSFIGWPGFCVEPDPKNPLYCVNWWPTDIIRGSVAQIDEEPLVFDEKVPLYYCALSNGRKSSEPNWLFYSHNNYKYTASRGNIIKILDKETITGDPFIFENNPCHDWNGLHSGIEFTIGGCSRAEGIRYMWGDISSDPEHAIYEYEIEKISLNKKSTDIEYPKYVDMTLANKLSKEQIALSIDSDLAAGMGDNEYAWVAACAYANRADDLPVPGVCTGDNQYGDLLTFAVIFNETGNPRNYFIKMDDYSGDFNDGAAWDVVYTLREACTQIIKVSQVEPNGDITTYPYWTRVDPFTGQIVFGLNYTYTTDSMPFGSVYQSGLSQYVRSDSSLLQNENDPTSWDSRPNENGNQPIYVEAFNPLTISDGSLNAGPNIRAGTPYSCIGDCNGSICVGGSKDGSLCSNDTTAESCYAGDGLNVGVCVGSWQTPANATGNNAQNSLDDLFVRTLGIYTWAMSTSTGQWQYIRTGDGWNNTSVGVDPIIDNVLVNDQTNTVVLSNGGTVKLTFTTNIANDQLPLRSYVIEWGDGSPNTSVQGYFYDRPSPGDPHILYHSYSGTPTGNRNIKITVSDNWNQVATYNFINAVNIVDGG